MKNMWNISSRRFLIGATDAWKKKGVGRCLQDFPYLSTNLDKSCQRTLKRCGEVFRLSGVDTTDTEGKRRKTPLRFPLSDWQIFWVAPLSERALDRI